MRRPTSTERIAARNYPGIPGIIRDRRMAAVMIPPVVRLLPPIPVRKSADCVSRSAAAAVRRRGTQRNRRVLLRTTARTCVSGFRVANIIASKETV